MIKLDRFPTLRSRMIAMVLLAVLLGAATLFGVERFSDWCVMRWYLSESAAQARTDALYARLEAYVESESVSSRDSAALQRWAKAQGYANVAVLLPDAPYEASWLGVSSLEDSRDPTRELSQWGYRFYTLSFADGPCAAALLDESELSLYDFGDAVAVALAVAVTCAVLLLHTRWLTRRIAALSAEVNAVSHGDLDHAIVPMYRDELSSLAKDVDTMRATIIQRAGREQSALQANSDLITALSHDIRNPLTALVGYLELLDMDRDQLPEADREYVRASLEKSFRIRDLTGEMFRYFLVFGNAAENVQLEEYDAQLVLLQLLGECAEDLISRDFQVHCEALETPCVLRTDVDLLKRVVDNLVSNIVKYADPAAPVTISAALAGDQLTVRFQNRVAPARSGAVESNRVGLRTCESILKLLHGVFEAAAEGERFTAAFTLPVKRT